MKAHADAPQVRIVDLAEVDERSAAQLLSPDECRRADAITVPAKRSDFVRTRAELRRTLAAHLGLEPADVAFEVEPGGRPRVLGNGPEFSVSHSHGVAAIAVAATRIGVDVERLQPRRSLLGIAAAYWHPDEVRMLEALAEDELPPRFFLLWTAKEAWIKATGEMFGDGAMRRCMWTGENVTPQQDYRGTTYAFTTPQAPPHFAAGLWVASESAS